MVYRGKPSAGCTACRKAKKACGLQLPACSRCVSLKKECSGYRDTTQLQIEDESESVIWKATRPKPKTKSRALPAPTRTNVEFGIVTPGTLCSEGSRSSSETIDLPAHNARGEVSWRTTHNDVYMDLIARGVDSRFLIDVKPKADDVSTNYFFLQFTAEGHWKFLRENSMHSSLDPCLSYAIKACGMAALENVSRMSMGKNYTRSMYVEALRRLNMALRDPVQSRTDNSLLAVIMLGYFENLTCDSRASIQSWRAHVRGAAQLLKLRGKAQFQTKPGRAMWREVKSHILIHSLWEDEEPPKFLEELEDDLRAATPDDHPWRVFPAEHPGRFANEFARLRSSLRLKSISDEDAAKAAARLEARMIQWSVDSQNSPIWRCEKIEVPDSPHIWNNTVTSFHSHPAPSTWQKYCSIRVMISRTRSLLCHRLGMSDAECLAQEQEGRRVRRQMTDDICASIPVSLGHAAPAFTSPCTLISAYAAIWPLFFAGTCALERVSTASWEQEHRSPADGTSLSRTSVAMAQVAWIIGRMDYICEVIGLKWAAGIAAVLKGEFRLHLGLDSNAVDYPAWLQKIQDSHRGARVLIEKESPLSDALNTVNTGPIWVGRYSGENQNWGNGL